MSFNLWKINVRFYLNKISKNKRAHENLYENREKFKVSILH